MSFDHEKLDVYGLAIDFVARRYRATRPKIKRKLAHLMFRRHGGRRARVRGCDRTRHDFALLAAAHNLARLARLGVHFDGAAWAR